MHVAEPPPPWYGKSEIPTQRSFIDTNLLVYADSPDEPHKQSIATQLLTALRLQGLGVISTQVLQEFANVGLNKLKLRHVTVRERLRFYRCFEVVQVTPEIIEAAVDLHQTRSVSYYDALVLASAKVAGCAVFYSEDMNGGETIDGVQLVNPFAS
jgi:predicted nucleic acid-binding protein